MPQTDPARALRTVRILWIALLGAQAAYLGVILSGARVGDAPLDLPAFPIALAFVAAATAAGAHACWRRAHGAGRPAHERPPPARAFVLYVLAWVLDESIAIYGLVLGLLAFPPAVWGPFSAAALGLTLAHRPVPAPRRAGAGLPS